MPRSSEGAIEKASIEDAEEILALQKLAYRSEGEIYDNFTIPPLHQTIAELLSEFDHRVILKIEIDNKIIGSVRAHLEDGTCHIGKLVVHPDHQNAGIGARLLHAADSQFPDAERYELFTGEKSEKNLYLYKKNDYRVFGRKGVTKKVTLVSLEKINN